MKTKSDKNKEWPKIGQTDKERKRVREIRMRKSCTNSIGEKTNIKEAK